MAKRVVSLAGRGLDHLYGPESQDPASPEPQPTESPPGANEGEMSPEWAAMLGGEAGPEGGSALLTQVSADQQGLPLLATQPAQPAELSEEPASLHTVFVVERAAVAEASARENLPAMSPVLARAESAMLSDPSRATLPPPREKPEAVDPLVRTKIQEMLRKAPNLIDRRIQSGGMVEGERAFEGGGEGQDPDYASPEQCQALWNEISELYGTVSDILSMEQSLPEALQLLREAQDALLERPPRFGIAKHNAAQVRSMVNKRVNSGRWGRTYGWGTLVYITLWVATLIAALLFSPVVTGWLVTVVRGPISLGPDVLSVLWNTMAWGGIGGVLGAYYSLYWHVSVLRDFDRQYLMWYVVQPIIGVLLGALVHLIVGAGLLSVTERSGMGTEVNLVFFPYAVAVIASFRQRFILELIDRIIQLLTPVPIVKSEQNDETESGSRAGNLVS